jgi:hypothetical protein
MVMRASPGAVTGACLEIRFRMTLGRQRSLGRLRA